MMKKRLIAIFAAAFLLFGPLFLLVANRYSGKCGSIWDSPTVSHCEPTPSPGHPPLVWRTCDESLTPPGKENGFLSMPRSFPVHVFSGSLHVISVLFIFSALLNSACHSCKDKDGDDSSKPVLQNKAKYQVSAKSLVLIFVLGIISLVYQGFSFLLIVHKCKPGYKERAAEVFCLISGSIEVVLQVCYLIFEARRIRHNTDRNDWAFLYIGTSNCLRWIHAIVNMACLNDKANALVVSEGVWTHLRPLFRTSVVFFYILAGMSYLCLLKDQDDSADSAADGSQKDSKNGSQNGSQKDSKNGSQNGSQKDSEKRTMATWLLCCSVVLTVVVLVFVIWTRSVQESFQPTCDDILNHGGHAEKLKAGRNFSRKKSIPFAVAHGLAMVTCLLLACLYLLKQKSNFSGKEVWHHMTEDPETIVFYVFSIGSLIYFSGSIGIHVKENSSSTSEIELISSCLGFFACLLQVIIVTSIKVQRTSVSGWYKLRALACLALFFTFVIQLVVSVLHEGFDHHVHTVEFLHGALPLAVDFFLSGAILMAEEIENLVL